MKIRIMEELIEGRMLLCPYVVCGDCDRAIEPGQSAHVLRTQWGGDVEDEAYHDGCTWPDPKGLSRPLGDWLLHLYRNSVER